MGGKNSFPVKVIRIEDNMAKEPNRVLGWYIRPGQ